MGWETEPSVFPSGLGRLDDAVRNAMRNLPVTSSLPQDMMPSRGFCHHPPTASMGSSLAGSRHGAGAGTPH